MTTITAQEFAQIMRDAIAQIQPAAPAVQQAPEAPDVIVDVDTQGIIAATEQATEAVNSVANIMNPYRDLTREQLVDEFTRLGYGNWAALGSDTQQELSRKLNMVKAIEEQAEAMIAYKQLNPRYIESGFERRAFDIFVKNTALSANGKPLGQTFAYVPQQIPRATISFNQKTGMYDLSQNGVVDHVKNYKDAEKWALMGGDYAEELRELRKIRQLTERREIKRPFVFQARKI